MNMTTSEAVLKKMLTNLFRLNTGRLIRMDMICWFYIRGIWMIIF